MTDETKQFKSLSVASITTGVALIDKFEGIHEVFSWVLGRDVWTHELPGAAKEATAAILAQHPAMPTECKEDWKETAADVLEQFGATVILRRGYTVRTMDPRATLRMLLGGSKNHSASLAMWHVFVESRPHSDVMLCHGALAMKRSKPDWPLCGGKPR